MISFSNRVVSKPVMQVDSEVLGIHDSTEPRRIPRHLQAAAPVRDRRLRVMPAWAGTVTRRLPLVGTIGGGPDLAGDPGMVLRNGASRGEAAYEQIESPVRLRHAGTTFPHPSVSQASRWR